MNELPMMQEAVELFIFEKTKKRIKIVFDQPMMMHRHFKMLSEAYYYTLIHNTYEVRVNDTYEG